MNVGQTATFTVVATGARAFELSVAEEPGEYRRGHVSKLHDTGDDERGQWDELPGDRNESGYECDEQRGDADGQRRSQHHDATGQPDGERGTDGDVHGSGDGRAAVELSVAEEPGEYRRSHVSKLHDAGDDERGQWDELPGDRNESGYECDEQRGDADGQRRSQHHDATGQPDGERGTDGDVHSGGDRCAAFELSVAEEPGEYRRGDVSELHDAGNDERGQWDELPGDRNESGYERDEQRGDTDGERRSQHHDATGEPDGERGTDGDIHGSGDRRAAVELSVAEEPGEYRRGDVSELHDAGDDECGQWNELPGDRNKSSHERNEQRGDTDGKRRSPDSEGSHAAQ